MSSRLVFPRHRLAAALLTGLAFATIAALAWGIWQVWLVCAVALVPLYLALAASTARER